MKKYIIILILTTFSLGLMAKDNLDGVYYTENSLYQIEIKGDKFQITAPRSQMYVSELMAEGKLKVISNDLIELSTLDPRTSGSKDLIFVQEYSNLADSDSITVAFSMPYTDKGCSLTISVTTSPTASRYFFSKDIIYLPKGDNSVCVAKGKELSFIVMPSTYSFHTFYGYFYGTLHFFSYTYEIEEVTNSIQIDIPALDNSFFEKFYFEKDYARIQGDIITWKGVEYKKKKN